MENVERHASNGFPRNRAPREPDAEGVMDEQHSDLEAVGDIALTGEGAGAGRTSMGTTGAAELGETEGGLQVCDTD